MLKLIDYSNLNKNNASLNIDQVNYIHYFGTNYNTLKILAIISK